MLRTILFLEIILLTSAFAAPIQRPLPGASASEVKSSCSNWALSAKSRGSQQLVIAFEGLGAFRKKAAKKLYKYHDELLKGTQVKRPGRTSMGFVADNILIKNLEKNFSKNSFLNLSHKGEGKKDSVSFGCFKEWHKIFGNELDLVLVGHSFGGPAAKRLMNTIAEEVPNFKINGMLSIDPRLKNKFVTRSNVKKHFVFYQKGFLRGYPYKDSRGGSFTVNTRVRGKDISGPEANNHANLTLFKGVQDAYLGFVQ